MAERWKAPIAVFDKMTRASLLTVLREEVGEASAENCATIKKKADLAVNVSERLPARWLPAPMIVGAFERAAPSTMDEQEDEAEEIEDDTENL